MGEFNERLIFVSENLLGNGLRWDLCVLAQWSTQLQTQNSEYFVFCIERSINKLFVAFLLLMTPVILLAQDNRILSSWSYSHCDNYFHFTAPAWCKAYGGTWENYDCRGASTAPLDESSLLTVLTNFATLYNAPELKEDSGWGHVENAESSLQCGYNSPQYNDKGQIIRDTRRYGFKGTNDNNVVLYGIRYRSEIESYVPEICPAPESGTQTPNPILPATGEKIKLQSDFTDSAPHSLDFTRTYRTAWGDVAPASGMGSNWNHRFGMQLTVTGGATALSKTLQMPDGSQRRFTRSSITLPWVNTDGTDQLVENAAGFLFTSAQNDDVWQFNLLGKPVTLTQRNGWAYALAYYSTGSAAGQLATVTNKFGRMLAFTYGASGANTGLLIGVAAPDGQSISYNYNSSIGGYSAPT